VTVVLLAHIADPLHAALYLSPALVVAGALYVAGRHLPDDDPDDDDPVT
jgi:hypothetical protein